MPEVEPEHDRSVDQVVLERQLISRLAYLVLGSETAAEDVVRATYVRWYLDGETRDQPDSPPLMWLIRTTVTACMEVSCSSPSSTRGGAGASRPAGSMSVRATALDDRVHSAVEMLSHLSTLTGADRVAFALNAVLGFTVDDAARLMSHEHLRTGLGHAGRLSTRSTHDEECGP